MSVTSADDIELQCSADVNGNIAADEQPEKENAINIKSIVKETPSYVCHVKLMTQAKELALALNKALGLKENGISYKHTPEIVKLMEKCGQELMDIGEYIIDTSVKLSDAHDHNLQNKLGPTTMENAETETVEAQESQCTETPSTSNGSTDTAASQETEISETVSQTENNSKVSNVFVCPLCHARFKLKEEFQMHVNKDSNEPFKCQKCSKIFFTQNKLNEHVVHHVLGSYKCDICGKCFDRRSSWYIHKKSHTGSIYSCLEPDCPYTVKSESHFCEHLKYYHLPTKTVKCTKCRKMFQMPSNMYHHQRVYHS